MLIEFSVANYRCFRDRVTLSMEAEPRISERDKSVDERNVAHTPEGDLLRVVAIYGANASGKSNLLRALSGLRSKVLYSAHEGLAAALAVSAFEPFRLDADSPLAPSELEVVFVQAGVQYRYGIAVSRERVEREWLFVRVADEEELRAFEREGDKYEVGPRWPRDSTLEQKTRAAALHLSVAATFNHPQAMVVLTWFRHMCFIDSLAAQGGIQRTTRLLRDKAHGEMVRTLMRQLDFGIDDLQLVGNVDLLDMTALEAARSMLDDGRQPPRVLAIRNGVPFDFYVYESAGTVKAFELAGPIVEALAGGDVVVIDELDARLHTLLAKQLVELFQDPTTNPHDAQLVFASHDTNLLTRTLLRRDQLWFVEKSRKTHSSDLYSLAELRFDDGKGVRNDARYEADYLQGRYGAIPFFGNLHAILGEALENGE
jgi:energy-coupling factor transporter ATP-binding protein EcfA2